MSFYKRAQILVADLWGCFQGQGDAAFVDIDSITMFADYRVPQVLTYLGALKYSDSLLKNLKEGMKEGATDYFHFVNGHNGLERRNCKDKLDA